MPSEYLTPMFMKMYHFTSIGWYPPTEDTNIMFPPLKEKFRTIENTTKNFTVEILLFLPVPSSPSLLHMRHHHLRQEEGSFYIYRQNLKRNKNDTNICDFSFYLFGRKKVGNRSFCLSWNLICCKNIHTIQPFWHRATLETQTLKAFTGIYVKENLPPTNLKHAARD